MGNCFALQGKVVRVIKKDGKVLEYRTPLRVHQVLADFHGQHAVSETIPATEYLQQDARLTAGRSYYLLSLEEARSKNKTKKVRFSDQVEMKGGNGDSAVRVKLVISRRKLQEMLEEGAVSVDHEAVSRVKGVYADWECDPPKGWNPVLKSIPEGN